MKLMQWFAAGVLVCPVLVAGNPQAAIASDLTRQLQQQNFGIQNLTQRQESDRLLAEGRTEADRGNLKAAVYLWKSAAERYRLVNDMEGQQRAYEYLSQAYAQQQRPTELEDALRQQLRFARARRDFPALVSHYNKVGELLLAHASTRQSEKTFSEALRIAQELKDVSGQGRSLTNLGLAALQRSDYPQATRYLTRSIALQQTISNLTAEAIAQNALGTAYRNLGESQKSAGAHLNALILARADETRDNTSIQDQAMAGLSIAYRNLGANQEAQRWLEARLIASGETTTISRIRSLQALAEFYQYNGDWAMSDRYYKEAIATATQGNYPKETQDLSRKLENLRRIYHLAPK